MMDEAGEQSRSRREAVKLLLAAACVSGAFLLVSFLEFDTWFYNNELPAYIRWGLVGEDDAVPREAFYRAARDACRLYVPNDVTLCEYYQLVLLATGSFARPGASAASALLTALIPADGFMPSLKFSMIWLGLGGALLAALLAAPILLRLPALGRAAIVIAWLGGWIGTRLMHTEALDGVAPVLLTAGILVGAAFAVLTVRRWTASRRQEGTPGQPGIGANVNPLFQALSVAACFAIGYWAHQLLEGRYPALYLMLGVALWPLLHGTLPALGAWTCGLLAGALYVASGSLSFLFMVYLPKGQQVCLLGAMILVAICRNDARIFWALPLLLLFDMQAAAQLCALIVVAEGLVALVRGAAPVALVPAAATALAATVVMLFTTTYSHANLFDFRALAAAFATPAVAVASLAAAVLVWTAARQRGEALAIAALDRLLIYAASVVAMAGISVAAPGEFAFNLRAMFREIAPAPGFAVIAGTVAMLLAHASANAAPGPHRRTASAASRQSALVALAALVILMSPVKGRSIGVSQFADGIRATFTSYSPPRWLRWPQMSLADDVVYLDAGNLMTSPLMQYSMIKVILRTRMMGSNAWTPTVAMFGKAH